MSDEGEARFQLRNNANLPCSDKVPNLVECGTSFDVGALVIDELPPL